YQAHGPLMIFALVYFELGGITGETRIIEESVIIAERILSDHLNSGDRLLREFVRPGGQVDESTDSGCTWVTGHALECLWFLDRIFTHVGQMERAALAREAMLWHYERGWDDDFGGIFLACHTK